MICFVRAFWLNLLFLYCCVLFNILTVFIDSVLLLFNIIDDFRSICPWPNCLEMTTSDVRRIEIDYLVSYLVLSFQRFRKYYNFILWSLDFWIVSKIFWISSKTINYLLTLRFSRRDEVGERIESLLISLLILLRYSFKNSSPMRSFSLNT